MTPAILGSMTERMRGIEMCGIMLSECVSDIVKIDEFIIRFCNEIYGVNGKILRKHT